MYVGTVTADEYDRDAQYPTWDDSDNDCLSNRHEVLIAQHVDDDVSNPLVYRDDGCLILTGKWYDPYDDTYYYSASDVQIDHVVALFEAHNSGAYAWTSTEKRYFANTGNKFPGTLPETSHEFLAVGASSNQSKGSSDPTDWMPNNSGYHCTYLKKWVEVKHLNNIYFDQDEYDFIKAEEANCDDSTLPDLPANDSSTSYICYLDNSQCVRK